MITPRAAEKRSNAAVRLLAGVLLAVAGLVCLTGCGFANDSDKEIAAISAANEGTILTPRQTDHTAALNRLVAESGEVTSEQVADFETGLSFVQDQVNANDVPASVSLNKPEKTGSMTPTFVESTGVWFLLYEQDWAKATGFKGLRDNTILIVGGGIILLGLAAFKLLLG